MGVKAGLSRHKKEDRLRLFAKKGSKNHILTFDGGACIEQHNEELHNLTSSQAVKSKAVPQHAYGGAGGEEYSSFLTSALDGGAWLAWL
jgi:hypothetical protein